MQRIVTYLIVVATLGAPGVAADATDHVETPDVVETGFVEFVEHIVNATIAYYEDFDPDDNATVMENKTRAFVQEIKGGIPDDLGVCGGDSKPGWNYPPVVPHSSRWEVHIHVPMMSLAQEKRTETVIVSYSTDDLGCDGENQDSQSPGDFEMIEVDEDEVVETVVESLEWVRWEYPADW